MSSFLSLPLCMRQGWSANTFFERGIPLGGAFPLHGSAVGGGASLGIGQKPLAKYRCFATIARFFDYILFYEVDPWTKISSKR